VGNSDILGHPEKQVLALGMMFITILFLLLQVILDAPLIKNVVTRTVDLAVVTAGPSPEI
jgi:hypothetical protein